MLLEHDGQWWAVRLIFLAIFGALLLWRRWRIKKTANMLLDYMWTAFWNNIHRDPEHVDNSNEQGVVGKWIYRKYTINVAFVHYGVYLLIFFLAVGSLFGIWQAPAIQDLLEFIKHWHLVFAVVIFLACLGLHELAYPPLLYQKYMEKKWGQEEMIGEPVEEPLEEAVEKAIRTEPFTVTS